MESRVLKQKTSLLSDMEDLCGHVIKAFNHFGPSIQQVVVLLGPTTVSPKEIYCLHFPTDFFEGKVLTAHGCISRLFRKLIGSEFMQRLGTLPCTKLRVFLEAPRGDLAVCDGLVPRLSFSLPQKRARRLDIHLECSAPVSSPELSHCEDSDLDISGIETLAATPKPPQNVLFSDLKSSVITDQNNTQLCDESTRRKSLDTTWTAARQSTEYIWYQVPVTLTGIKHKAKPSSSSQGIFMT